MQRLGPALAREHKFPIAPDGIKNRDSAVAERDAMLSTGLHSLAWHRPKLVVEVDLGPSRPYDLARPRGRKDREFERAGWRPLLRTKLGHEGAHVAIGNRVVMLDRSYLCFRREQFFQVSRPTRRIVACSITGDRRPGEHSLEPRPHAGCRLWRLVPDRLQDFDHEAGV